jgi:hypothetical protein
MNILLFCLIISIYLENLKYSFRISKYFSDIVAVNVI